MTRRQYGGFFAIAVIGMLVAIPLPLSSEPAPALYARPELLAALLVAAALFAAAGKLAPALSVAVGLTGVVVSCAMSLDLLRDSAIAGNASTGFWLPVLATWLAAGLCVARLADIKVTKPPHAL